MSDVKENGTQSQRYLRIISDLVRFGCGYRILNVEKQYFAWNGYPDRDSDYFTTSEISEVEFDEISKKYRYRSVLTEMRRRFSAKDM